MRILNFLNAGIILNAVLGVQLAFGSCSPLLDYNIRRLADTVSDHLCSKYENQVIVVVNTASKCGYTPQFEPLEALYQKYKSQGFAVLGFPSKDFGSQEFETETKTAEFCSLTYGVQFPMYSYTRAKEGVASPLFEGLARSAGGDYPDWNFHKYVINRRGVLIGSLDASAGPRQLETLIRVSLSE